MVKFSYTAQDSQGNATAGVIEAADEDQAVLELQNKGYFILSIQSQKYAKKVSAFRKMRVIGRIGGYDLAFFAEQLATLLAGGIPLVKALSLLSEHVENRSLGKVVSDVNKEVSAGGALYKALSKHPKVFNNVWISLVQAGEMGGQLPNVLRQIALYIHSKETLKSKIITALSYPAILISFALGVLTYFMVSIVPKFALTFADFNMQLPFLTRMIISISNLLSSNIVAILAAVVLIVVFFRIYLSTEGGRFTYNRFTLKFPIFGKFIRNVQFERLLTTMSTLIKSGVSILTVISVLEEGFSKNLVIKRALKSIRQDVASGKSISVSFKNTKVFPDMITEMMWMGEESGKLPDIINILSKFYIEKINQFISRFASLIDPILIISVGGVIAIIIISLFLPILKLTRIGVISG